mgnify:CR=1 FL=1
MRQPGEPASEVLRNFLEFFDSALAGRTGLPYRAFKAMIDMVLNQDLLGLRDCFFDRVQLLGQFQAGPLVRHHLQNAAQMAFRALEALDDGVVMVMRVWKTGFGHGYNIIHRMTDFPETGGKSGCFPPAVHINP